MTFSEENMLAQITQGSYELGFYKVHFYSKDGLPSTEETETVSEFYLYPSGGALRDKNFNIVFYSAKFDTYRGFIPPGKKD
jgi:hypothetical protein